MTLVGSDMQSIQPIIGLTSYTERARYTTWNNTCVLLPVSYIEAVTEAGGCPVILPTIASFPGRALAALHGLILTGGGDIDPALYGGTPHPAIERVREERDAFEIALLQAAIQLKMPILGMCRGAQIMNVGLGGSLIQHLPDQLASTDHHPVEGKYGTHSIAVVADSKLGAVLGCKIDVECHHHQAVDSVGHNLHAVAFSSDGTVEAVELAGENFAIGVQWHPERNANSVGLLSAFISAAQLYRKSIRSTADL
ncbi:MAG: gamma-glutamyl-gamma-aminobutyrate hydrolase family protein [Pseudonocardiaceae bacterium]